MHRCHELSRGRRTRSLRRSERRAKNPVLTGRLPFRSALGRAAYEQDLAAAAHYRPEAPRQGAGTLFREPNEKPYRHFAASLQIEWLHSTRHVRNPSSRGCTKECARLTLLPGTSTADKSRTHPPPCPRCRKLPRRTCRVLYQKRAPGDPPVELQHYPRQ